MRHALVTGGAGFIGSHLVDRLLAEGWMVTVVDNFDPFYDKTIKLHNIRQHLEFQNYSIFDLDIRNFHELKSKLSGQYDVIVHIAGKAGVRPSIQDPVSYQAVNTGGTQNLLELAKIWGVKQFIFASSSSVYGVNPNVPWRESDPVLMPISPYAATKISCELLGHVYSKLYGIRFISLRFFTVYGPRQRPDLAIHKFFKLMLEGEQIPVFGDGTTRRDYTHVHDIIQGVRASMEYKLTPYEVINLGNDHTVTLNQLIKTLENALGVKAKVKRLPVQPGDVPETWANPEKAKRLLSYEPQQDFEAGIGQFSSWLLDNSGKYL